MLKYTEIVLQKVSFNKELFNKELRKSLKWLKNEEVKVLRSWCVMNYGNTYGDVIFDVFN